MVKKIVDVPNSDELAMVILVVFRDNYRNLPHILLNLIKAVP
jgi:hypothetical protein